VGATWGHRLHNFLAVGAIAPIAPMESAPMFVTIIYRTTGGLQLTTIQLPDSVGMVTAASVSSSSWNVAINIPS